MVRNFLQVNNSACFRDFYNAHNALKTGIGAQNYHPNVSNDKDFNGGNVLKPAGEAKNKVNSYVVIGSIALAALLFGLMTNFSKIKNFVTNAINNLPKKPAGRNIPLGRKPGPTPNDTVKALPEGVCAHTPSPKATPHLQDKAQNEQNPPTVPHFKINGIVKGSLSPTMQRLTALVDKENVSQSELREVEEIFKNYTGITLHCPETFDFKAFMPFFSTTVNFGDYKKIDPEIKHIIAAHGIGSASSGNWRFLGSGNSVFDYVEKVVPKGEKALLVVCESGSGIRPGLGTAVKTNLVELEEPGKVVKSGVREIIGTLTLLNDGNIQYFNR